MILQIKINVQKHYRTRERGVQQLSFVSGKRDYRGLFFRLSSGHFALDFLIN